MSSSPNTCFASLKYMERSLSASRRRSNSNSRKAPSPIGSVVSLTSKEGSSKATPKRNNGRIVDGNAHQITIEEPSTPNPSLSRSSFPTLPDDSHTPGNDDRKTAKEWSEATTPSILQREEIFHHKAAANIVRLLTPDRMYRGLSETSAFEPIVSPGFRKGQQVERNSQEGDARSPR
jgi:hypothetical protein